MSKIRQVENNVKMFLKHWGFGEVCSSIYAALTLSSKPLTARELSRRMDYAYTTTINALNHSIGLGHVKKMRQGKKYVYYIDVDLADIVKEKLGHFLKLLENTEKFVSRLDSDQKKNLEKPLKTIRNTITFLKKIKKVEALV